MSQNKKAANLEGLLRLVGRAVLEKDYLKKLQKGQGLNDTHIPLTPDEKDYLLTEVAPKLAEFNNQLDRSIRKNWRHYKGR